MANFKQAKEWMRKGKKVRRPIWDTDSYWQVANDQSERIVWSDGTNAVIHLKQLEANDWCVYSPASKQVNKYDIQKLKLEILRNYGNNINMTTPSEYNTHMQGYKNVIIAINKFMETLKHG